MFQFTLHKTDVFEIYLLRDVSDRRTNKTSCTQQRGKTTKVQNEQKKKHALAFTVAVQQITQMIGAALSLTKKKWFRKRSVFGIKTLFERIFYKIANAVSRFEFYANVV